MPVHIHPYLHQYTKASYLELYSLVSKHMTSSLEDPHALMFLNSREISSGVLPFVSGRMKKT